MVYLICTGTGHVMVLYHTDLLYNTINKDMFLYIFGAFNFSIFCIFNFSIFCIFNFSIFCIFNFSIFCIFNFSIFWYGLISFDTFLVRFDI